MSWPKTPVTLPIDGYGHLRKYERSFYRGLFFFDHPTKRSFMKSSAFDQNTTVVCDESINMAILMVYMDK